MDTTRDVNAAIGTGSGAKVEAVMHGWKKALATHDLEGLVACYAPDAHLGKPGGSPHHPGGPGIRRGHDSWRGVDVLINDQYHRD